MQPALYSTTGVLLPSAHLWWAGAFWAGVEKLPNGRHKKRPNTIPIFGLGKWLLGESRALKVGINAGCYALHFIA
ncbi:hypothetical protein C1N62_09735 [Nissabacter sp. SGAir0207]|nr:hypothetical protein C1N62_09735 [Nissabacter sp. SGAir0207]